MDSTASELVNEGNAEENTIPILSKLNWSLGFRLGIELLSTTILLRVRTQTFCVDFAVIVSRGQGSTAANGDGRARVSQPSG